MVVVSINALLKKFNLHNFKMKMFFGHS